MVGMTDLDGRTALYRLYDARGWLLYVGITGDPDARFAQHKADKPWWREVVSKSVEWHGTREAAAAAEIAAIRSSEPKYNREHSVGAVVTLRLTSRVQAEGLDLLCGLFGQTREHVLGSLVIRELSARGLLGTGPCFHKAIGWPEGLTVNSAHYGDEEECSCGALVSDAPDCWYQWRLQLAAEESATA